LKLITGRGITNAGKKSFASSGGEGMKEKR